MPTLVGLVFFIASIWFLLLDNDLLFGLVLISSIFESSSIVATESHGVQPYYMVAFFFVLQCVYRGRYFGASTVSFKGRTPMLLFAVLAIASAFLYPRIFAGIPVYDPYVGIDDGLFLRPPLHFALANFTQTVYLLLDVLVVVGIARTPHSPGSVKRFFMITFYLLAGIVVMQFLCFLTGIPFPYGLLQTHAGYSMEDFTAGDLSTRFPGTFVESSSAGLALATFTAGFLADRFKFGRSLGPALIGLFCIVLVRSSGSLAAIALLFVLLLIAHPVWRFPLSIDTVMLRRGALLLSIAAVAILLAVFSPLHDSIARLTLDKQASSSYINRTAADLYALTLFEQTHGIGVGMGSNRPSSLIASLLSTVGLAGCVLFLIAYFRLLMNATGEFAWVRWAGLVLLINAAISNPDFVRPWIWVILGFAVQVGTAAPEAAPEPIAIAEPAT